MRKNNLILLLLFVVFGSAAWYFLKYKNSNTSINTADRDFAVKNVNDIYKIFLGQKNGDNIVLERKGSDWFVNNKYKVFPNTLHYLLETIENLQVNSIPPKPSYPVIMQELATMGIKVEIYDRNNQPIKTYYVGGVTEDETGLYCLMEGAKQPYIMHINKAPTNLRVRYDIQELGWRDRTLLDLPNETIEGIELTYPFEKERSFSITNIQSEITLLDENKKPINLEIKQKKLLKAYTEEFNKVSAEAIINDHPRKDSICKLDAYLNIKIKTKDGKELQSKFYPCPDDGSGDVSLDKEFLQNRKFFRFYTCRSDGDFLLIQFEPLSTILADKTQLLQRLSDIPK